MSTPSPPNQDDAAQRATVLRGIGYMCLGAMVLPFLNAAVKYLSAHYPIPQIMWARFAGHLAFMLLLFGPRLGLGILRTRRPAWQLTRSVCLLTATACYFTGLPHVALATAAAIGFTSPLIVTALAVPMLGEPVGIRRALAVAFGFAGALVIIRPGLGATHPAVGLFLVAALAYALYQIFTRRVAAYDGPETSITYAAVVGTLATTPLVPLVWVGPRSLLDAALFVSLGVIAGTGHFFVVKAFQRGRASVVSPFIYLQLIGATLLGLVLFGHLPDRWTWTGALMIVASGLYVLYRETRRGREASAETDGGRT